ITSPFGAIFATANGVYGVRNTGGFYKFDLNNGSATLVSSSPPSDNNDGASCPDTVPELPADLETVKTDGSTTYSAGSQVVYTITVSNNGPFGVAGALVNDPLPAGIVSANWTCSPGMGGGVCGM